MSAVTAIQPCLDNQQAHVFYDTIKGERDAISRFLRKNRQADVERIIALLARQTKPVIFTGIGKSGHIAAKIAATFSSLDTAAIFLNAAEAAHGDLGVVQPRSVVVLLSNSGTTQEITRIVPVLKSRGCILVAIVGSMASPLAHCADHVIHAEIEKEVDPIGMAPTASTTLQLAIGDALAVAVSQSRGFTQEDFLRHHPAGLLGRQMIRVNSLMRQGEDLPTVVPNTPMIELLAVMSAKRMGAACVIGSGEKLLGLVVDGDVRRHLQLGEDIASASAGDLMQVKPHTVHENITIGHALSLRKRAATPWLVIPVLDDAGCLKGMLHAQDVLG